MSFNWKAIESYEDSEVALYRLLGEMLRRKATLDDLDRIRAFLVAGGLNSEGWMGLGEALHRTTSGSPVGFDIWLAWLQSCDDVEVDIEQLGMVWIDFGEDLSEASEATDFDPNRDMLPGAEAMASRGDALPELSAPASTPTIDDLPSMAEDDDDTDSTSMLESQPVLRSVSRANTGVLGQSPTQLMRLVPQGPFHLRIFGIEHRDVDEYTVLTLIKRGLFLAAEVQFGDRWLASWEHPAFERISASLRAETARILRRGNDSDEPKTHPLGP